VIKGVEEISWDFNFRMLTTCLSFFVDHIMTPPPQRHKLNEGEQGEIIRIRKGGMSYAAIGRELCVNPETVRQVWIYYEITGARKPPPWPSRPTILQKHDRRVIKHHVTKNREGRREPLCDITKKFNLNICIDTLAKEFNNLSLIHRITR
jgi:hypothetical protein